MSNKTIYQLGFILRNIPYYLGRELNILLVRLGVAKCKVCRQKLYFCSCGDIVCPNANDGNCPECYCI